MFPTFPTVLSIWGLLVALYTHMLTHTHIYIYYTICLSLSIYIPHIITIGLALEGHQHHCRLLKEAPSPGPGSTGSAGRDASIGHHPLGALVETRLVTWGSWMLGEWYVWWLWDGSWNHFLKPTISFGRVRCHDTGRSWTGNDKGQVARGMRPSAILAIATALLEFQALELGNWGWFDKKASGHYIYICYIYIYLSIYNRFQNLFFPVQTAEVCAQNHSRWNCEKTNMNKGSEVIGWGEIN